LAVTVVIILVIIAAIIFAILWRVLASLLTAILTITVIVLLLITVLGFFVVKDASQVKETFTNQSSLYIFEENAQPVFVIEAESIDFSSAKVVDASIINNHDGLHFFINGSSIDKPSSVDDFQSLLGEQFSQVSLFKSISAKDVRVEPNSLFFQTLTLNPSCCSSIQKKLLGEVE